MGAVCLWGWDDTNNVWVKVLVDEDGKLHISSSALPDGAATYGMQNQGNQYINLIRLLLNARLPSVLDTDALKVREQNWPATYPLSAAQVASLRSELFGGNVYSKTMTMTDNNATRFEATAKLLRDVVIIVKTYGMLLGETGVVVYPVGAGETVGFTKVDISTLYFQNAGADDDATITILGVEE